MLGILTILSVMGTAFARFMRTEFQSSKYYSLKKNVEQLAEDGVTFAYARLAKVAAQAHWSGLKSETWPYETSPVTGKQNFTAGNPPTGFLYTPLDSPNAKVSFPDLVADPGGRISFRRDVTRSTMEPNGDVVKLKVIECQGQLNVRSLAMRGRDTFFETMQELGEQLAAKTASMANNPLTGQVVGALWWSVNGGDVSNIAGNPPPPQGAMPFGTKTNFLNKEHFLETLRQIHEQIPALAGRNLWRYVEDCVTTTSWPFDSGPAAQNNQFYEDRDSSYGQPLDGDTTYYTNRRDGLQGNAAFPGQKEQYNLVATQMAPININTAPFELIVAWLNRLEGERPYYDVRRFAWIVDSETGDIRMNEIGGGIDQTKNRGVAAPGFANNAVLKFIRIGPFRSSASPLTWTNNTVEKLADLIIFERERAPFTSFKDFDQRLISRLDTNSNGGYVANVGGNGLRPTPCNGIDALPDPLAPLTTASLGVISLATGAGVPYPECFSPNWETFYRAACRDLLRAALNPVPKFTKYNPDDCYFENIDAQDVTWRNGPICFHSYGLYEITSLAQINGPVFDAALGDYVSKPVAEAQVRAVVKLLDVKRHRSQREFMTGVGMNITTPPSSGNQSLTQLTTGYSQTYPNCVNDARNFGLFNYSDIRGGIATTCPEWGYVTSRPIDRTPFQRRIMRPGYEIGYIGYNGNQSSFLGSNTRFLAMFISGLPPAGWSPSPQGEGWMRDQFWGTSTWGMSSRLYVNGFNTANNSGDVRQFTDFVTDGIYMRGHGRLNNDPGTPEPNDPVTRYFRMACGNNSDQRPIYSSNPGDNGVAAQNQSNGYVNLQNTLQNNTNIPYYRGTVEFWIKFNVDFWDMTNADRPDKGRATPLSAHDADSFFCGLLGSTEFVRRDANNAEGMQMFIFKDVGQRLRITRMYFGQAYRRNGASVQALGDVNQTLQHADWKEEDPNNPGKFVNNNDMGVVYSRVDTIVKMANLPFPILPHHWYHFAIGWDAGDAAPDNQVRVFINGRRCIVASELFAMSQAKADEGLNTGRVLDPNTDPVTVAKSAVTINELDPGDRVTIGGIERYMLAPNWCHGPTRVTALFAVDTYPKLFQFAEDPANPNLPFRLVAAANATLDTVRATNELINFDANLNFQDRNDLRLFGRYNASYFQQNYAQNGYPNGWNIAANYFENGWQNTYGRTVKVAWMSWSEGRPKNDPTRPMGGGVPDPVPPYINYVPPQNNLTPQNTDYVQMFGRIIQGASRTVGWNGVNLGLILNSETYRPTAAAPQAVRDLFTTYPAGAMRRDVRNYTLPNTPNLTWYGGMVWENGQDVDANGLILYRAYFRRGEQLIATNSPPFTTACINAVEVAIICPPSFLEYTPVYKR